MEEMACLYFVERNDNIFEENNMLFPQGYSKTRNNTGQDVQKFRCSIEFESFVDEAVEAIVDCLSDHFSPWHELGIKSMENIF